MIYVITAVHNRYSITEEFINNLEAQVEKNLKLILVDDGSTDNTAQMVKERMPDAEVLIGNGNLWWGGAMEYAYNYIQKISSPQDIVFIANDDSLFNQSYITDALKILDDNWNTVLVGCGISKQTGKQVDGAVSFDFIRGRANILRGERAFGNCGSTRSLFVRANDYIRIGHFHPVLLPHYGSDYEWTIRAARKGYKILCDQSLKYYVNEETTGDHTKSRRSIKQVFSKRSVSNPLYKTAFCFLASPWGLKSISFISMCYRFITHR